MNQRLREVRKALGLKQREVAAAVHVADSTVASWETGSFTPGDRTIYSFCAQFHVNEDWLRTGEGEMFLNVDKKEQITKFVADVLTDDDSFKMRLISALTEMDVDEWTILESLVDKLNKNPQ